MRAIVLPRGGYPSGSSGVFLTCHRISKTLILITCVMMGVLMTGCTTLQPMTDNAVSLRNGLRSGELVKPGDRVSVVTRDGLTRLLIVTDIDQNTLKGHPEGKGLESTQITISIDDIVYMDGEKVSAEKTIERTGGAVVGTGVALILTIIAFLVVVL